MERRRPLLAIDNQGEEQGLHSKPCGDDGIDWRFVIINKYDEDDDDGDDDDDGEVVEDSEDLCLAVQSLVRSSCCTAKINSLPP